jgi:hypothetical protein
MIGLVPYCNFLNCSLASLAETIYSDASTMEGDKGGWDKELEE